MDVNRLLLLLIVVCGLMNSSFARQSTADEYSDDLELIKPRVRRTTENLEEIQAQALVMDGRILRRRGRLATALRKYQRAWRLSGESGIILKQIVPLALELGRVQEATRYALLLANSQLDDPFLAERLAMLMSDQTDYDRSLQLYQRVLQLRDQDPEARNPIAMQFEMGRLYYLTEKYDQASQAFRVVLEAIENENSSALSDAFRKVIRKDSKPIFTLIAESFLESGEYESALRVFERANQAAPDQDWLTFQTARVNYRAGHYEEAKDKLQTYVNQKLRFGGETPYELMQDMMERATNGHASHEKQQPSSIFVRFRDWLADDPENFPLLSYVAEMTRREGVLNDAAALYEKSIEKQPTAKAYRQLLTLYRELNDIDKLLDLLSRITGDIGDFDGFEKQIKMIVKDDDLVDQLLDAGRRLSADNESSDVAKACGLLALEAKAYLRAEEFFAMIKKEKNQTDLYITWGLQLLVDEKYGKATTAFQEGIRQEVDKDKQAVLMYYLSGALQLDGKTDDALETAKKVAELGGQIPEFALRPAWILYNANRLDEAESKYSEWLDEHAEDYSMPGLREVVRDSRLVVSSICVEQNKPHQACEWLEKVLDEFPQDVAAMNDLGYLMVDENLSLDRAMKMIHYAVEKEPENGMYRDSLGWGFFRQGKFREAVIELRKASSDEVPDPIILDHLAEALQSSGDEKAAVETWQRAFSLLDENKHEELRKKIETQLEHQLAETQ